MITDADYRFRPCADPSPEWLVCHGPGRESEWMIACHLQQLMADLLSGAIGFEWYTELSQQELARIGWDTRS